MHAQLLSSSYPSMRKQNKSTYNNTLTTWLQSLLKKIDGRNCRKQNKVCGCLVNCGIEWKLTSTTYSYSRLSTTKIYSRLSTTKYIQVNVSELRNVNTQKITWPKLKYLHLSILIFFRSTCFYVYHIVKPYRPVIQKQWKKIVHWRVLCSKIIKKRTWIGKCLQMNHLSGMHIEILYVHAQSLKVNSW